MSRRIVDVVESLLDDFVEKQEMELVDVEFVKEGPHRYLRVTVDKNSPVTLEDCQMVSEFLSKELDALDLIEEQYFLEVSSPGIERVLKKDNDIVKFEGTKVMIHLYQPMNGSKHVIGRLVGLRDANVVITMEENGEEIEIPRSKVSLIKTIYDFDE